MIYTLGTSTRGLEEFMEILVVYEIESVVDVRRFPTSRQDHFKGENLATVLPAGGIEYLYLGSDLGGFRKGGYEAHMETREFQRGIEALMSRAEKRKTAMICAERLPWKCHRRFIARALEKRGWTVIHVLEKDRTWSPRDTGETLSLFEDSGSS